MTRAKRLRQLIAKDCVAMPGVPNASIARQVERAGFDAVYISGAGLANCTAGLPDIGLLTLTEVAMLAGFIAKTVKIPAIVDGDTGFGGAENAARTIYELESAGLAGCHLEDQEFPKRCGHLAGKSLIASADMEEKIATAVAAKRDKDFLLISRLHESDSGIFARSKSARESARLAGENADAGGALPIARLRPRQRFVDWLSLMMGVIPSEAEETRCENCEVTLRDSSNPLCSARVDGKAS